MLHYKCASEWFGNTEQLNAQAKNSKTLMCGGVDKYRTN